MTNPIPQHLMGDLAESIKPIYEDRSLPDGVWWRMMEDTAQFFMDKHGLDGSTYEAVHQVTDKYI